MAAWSAPGGFYAAMPKIRLSALATEQVFIATIAAGCNRRMVFPLTATFRLAAIVGRLVTAWLARNISALRIMDNISRRARANSSGGSWDKRIINRIDDMVGNLLNQL